MLLITMFLRRLMLMCEAAHYDHSMAGAMVCTSTQVEERWGRKGGIL